jgi:hypothetical protein
MSDSPSEIESDIAQLKRLRERALEGGQTDWAEKIDAEIAKKQEQLKEFTESGQDD